MPRGEGSRNVPIRRARLRSNYAGVVNAGKVNPDTFIPDVISKQLQTEFDKMQLDFNYRMDKGTKTTIERMLESIEGDLGDQLYATVESETKKLDTCYSFNPNTILKIRYYAGDKTTRRMITMMDLKTSDGIQKLMWDGEIKAIVTGQKEYYLLNKDNWHAFLASPSIGEIYDALDEGILNSNGDHYANMETFLQLTDIVPIDNLLLF